MRPHVPLAAILAAAAGPALALGAATPVQAATPAWSPTATLAVPVPNGATTLGQLAGSTPISITVGLALRNQATLDNFIADASTPSSPEYGAQGQTMFASAGDTGASCAVESTNGVPDSGPPMVNYPASSPYVVGVGGTRLHRVGHTDTGRRHEPLLSDPLRRVPERHMQHRHHHR